ncbi:hypothetical protein SPHI_05430 [Sphingomonas jeddahensis]|uniref:Copper chaperone n=1 Tax=Sphingomonas jeddahensis TaxID=1915074 RepID=A0A1V2EWQ3_9SPHN|nr:hypothetical protein SPHI_05430 [Sphingomonas jeddahensis]
MQFHVDEMSGGSCVRRINKAVARADLRAPVGANMASRTINVTGAAA